jgi:hypothetical protein
VIAGALASRAGRDPGDLQVRVLAGAVIGVMMSVYMPDNLDPATEAEAEALAGAFMGPDSVSRIDEALALLEQGLPL